MKYTFRPLSAWTGPRTPAHQRRSRWAFKANWQSTIDLLARELEQLDAQRVVIEADFRERDIRLDGLPRADARQPAFPGVRIAFESRHGPLVYATDSCEWWQHNVRSIALGLGALRAVDRYGITRRAEQYQGYRAIGAGPATPMPAAMTVEEAARFIAEHADPDQGTPALVDRLSREPAMLDAAYKMAARRLHPDAGGDTALFQRLQEAKRLLYEHHGSRL